jgi:hypothetical protein
MIGRGKDQASYNFESNDLESARKYVLVKGASNVTLLEQRLGITCLNFYHYDGIGLMVYQSLN